MRDVVFSKTETGLQEMQTRELRLAPRLRSLLIQIDGKRSVGSLLEVLDGTGITAEHFTQLVDAGLIQAPEPVQPTVVPQGAPAAPDGGSLAVQAERQMALYRVCNEAIGSSLGLRGFKLLLQLEKIGGIAEYHNFSQVLIESVRKARGDEEAERLQARIVPLLTN